MSARTMTKVGLAVLLTLTLTLPANAGEAVTVQGKVQGVTGESNAGAVVYIDSIPGDSFEPAPGPVVVDQKDLKFVPHVLPVLVGTTVTFKNSDDVLHNVFTPDKVADRFDLGTFGQGEERTYTFDKPGEAVLLCNVHPEMEAWVVVVPTPYFATTADDGSYRIEGVPAGEYTLKVWHASLKKPMERAITVDGSGPVTADLQVR